MPGKRGTGPKRPPLEPLNTAAAQSQKPVYRLSDAEREQLEAIEAPDESSAPEVMSKIKPWIFLGGLADALDSDFLHTKGVTHVLNVAKECESNGAAESESGENEDKYLKLELSDHADEDIEKKGFDAAFDFINGAKEKGGKVLIHCQRGISRSATITIGYLMDSDRLSLDQAFAFVRRRRPIINPHLGFQLVLESYYAKLIHRQGAQRPQAALHGLQSPQVPQLMCIDPNRVSPLLPTPTTDAAQVSFVFPPVRNFHGGCAEDNSPQKFLPS